MLIRTSYLIPNDFTAFYIAYFSVQILIYQNGFLKDGQTYEKCYYQSINAL